VLPLTLVGCLSRPRGIARRIAIATGVLLAAFTLMSGKQPHYLLPLMPGCALWAADALQRRERSVRVLHASSSVLLGALLVAAPAAVWLGRAALVSRYEEHARALFSSPAWWSLWAGGLCITAWALWRLLRARPSVAAIGAGLLAGCAGIMLPVHYALGELALPAELAAALRAEPDTPLATYHAFQSGYFNWIGRRDRVAPLETRAQYAAWCRMHPDGLIVQPLGGEHGPRANLVAIERIDRFRGESYCLCRARAGPGASTRLLQEETSGAARRRSTASRPRARLDR
jgi:hypothetical protein